MAKEIEISKTGIKFSYHRFVADSAPGFVLILIFLFFDKKYTLNVFVNFEKETKVLIGILLFFLATPLGLCINGISWFILQPIVNICEKFFLKKFQMEKKYLLLNLLNFNKKLMENWIYYMSIFENIIEERNLEPNIDYVKGVKKFFRSLSLICLIVSLLLIFLSTSLVYILILIIFSFFCIFFAGAVQYYQHGEIVRKVYILYATDEKLKNELKKILGEKEIKEIFKEARRDT